MPRVLGAGRGLVGLLCAALVAVTGCAKDTQPMTRHRVICEGASRTYHLHLPGACSDSEPLPLVLVLHRLTETGPRMARMTGFNEIAARERFIVAYPKARLRAWNAFGFMSKDDVAFLRSVVKDISEHHHVDAARVYVTGASSGGYMTSVAMAQAPDVFAAGAAVMATIPRWVAEGEGSSSPAPMIFIHGTKDPIVPYHKSRLHAVPFLRLKVLSVPDSVSFWARRNGCVMEPVVEELPDREPSDRTRVIRETYASPDGNDVVLYRVEGGGHTWPGGWEPYPQCFIGPVSRDLDATEAIWEFFANHPKR